MIMSRMSRKLGGLLMMFFGVICLIHLLTIHGTSPPPGLDDKGKKQLEENSYKDHLNLTSTPNKLEDKGKKKLEESSNKDHNKLTSVPKLHDNGKKKLKKSSNEYDLELRGFKQAPWGEDGEPSGLYEATRHRLRDEIKELSYYVSNTLKAAIAEQDPKKHNATLLNILAELERRENMLLVEQQRLSSVDGHAERRARHAADLSDLVQRRLRALQNPPDCAAAKKLICDLNLSCGFGCQIHHVVYCLRAAYATERTLILRSRAWAYQPKWDSLFEPISDNCYDITYDEHAAVEWPGSKKAQVIVMPRRLYGLLGIPKDLIHRIMSFSGDPAAWFMGQILKYCLRPRASFQKAINDTIGNLNYRHPVVGVHIRRTDKLIGEAEFHSIEEYMQQAENYWVRRDLARKPGDPLTPRRVYLATDEAAVWEKARNKYPSVEFLGDERIARSAALNSRWSLASLTGVMVDLLLLSRSDYLVCTFSSNVGRAAYELMQTNRVDASESYYSIDDILYHFFGVYPHIVRDIVKFSQKKAISGEEDQWVLLPWLRTEKVPMFYNYPKYKQVTANTVRNETKNVL